MAGPLTDGAFRVRIMTFPPILETSRLLLRAVADTDIDALFAACSNPTLTAYTLDEQGGRGPIRVRDRNGV